MDVNVDVDVDATLRKLGHWGRWQVTFYVLVSAAANFAGGFQMFAIVFLGSIPDHTCKTTDEHLNSTIPLDDEGQYEQCIQYINSSISNATESCPHGYSYWDWNNVGPTIVSEWDLVCNRAYLVDLSQSILTVGLMIGAVSFAALSDRFGRKPIFLLSQWATILVGIAVAASQTYPTFAALRFLIGILQQGLMLTGFILACELVPADQRTFSGTIYHTFWAFSMCIMAVMAYFIRQWRLLQLAYTLPGLLTIAFYWLLSESIPWLCANRRYDDAEKILRKAAKTNKLTLSYPIIAVNTTSQCDDISVIYSLKESRDSDSDVTSHDKKTPTGASGERPATKVTLATILCHRRLCCYLILSCLLWLEAPN